MKFYRAISLQYFLTSTVHPVSSCLLHQRLLDFCGPPNMCMPMVHFTHALVIFTSFAPSSLSTMECKCPAFFFLLPNKTKQTYEQMLRMLLESFESSTSSLSIEIIHIDQEAAMAEAVRNTSNFVIKFCHFHIRQSWLRKIQTLGLITDYKNEESDIGNWLKLFFGLPALSHEEVDDVFAFCLMVKQPESEKCEAFADYIFNNYISTSAPFQPPA